jgi:membrane protease YdiL (CAAX protease family)
MAQDFSISFNNLDVILAIITILVCMLVATSYQINTNRALVSIIFAVMMIGAITIHTWMRTEKEEEKEQIKELNTLGWMNSILFGLIGFILIAIVQFSVIMTLNFEYLSSLDPYDRMFGFVAAETEEWYFRALLLTYLIRLTGEYIISTIICSAIFTMYHYVVYVLFLGSVTTLAAVFASSIILCGIFILTRSLTAPVISHAINNVGLRVVF